MRLSVGSFFFGDENQNAFQNFKLSSALVGEYPELKSFDITFERAELTPFIKATRATESPLITCQKLLNLDIVNEKTLPEIFPL